MYGKAETNCWEVDSTLCVHPHMDEDFFKKKGLDKCEICLYRKSLGPKFQN